MNKFAAGLITGGVIGAAGLGYALSDRRTMRRVRRDSRRVMDKAGEIIENISGNFK